MIPLVSASGVVIIPKPVNNYEKPKGLSPVQALALSLVLLKASQLNSSLLSIPLQGSHHPLSPCEH